MQRLYGASRPRARSGSSLYNSLQAKDEALQSAEALQTSNATVVQRAMTAAQSSR